MKTRGGRRDGAGRPVGSSKDRPPRVEISSIGPLIADRLRQTIGDQGSISLRDLAAASAVSVPTLRAILAGRGDPKASALLRLARSLHVRVGWLIGDES